MHKSKFFCPILHQLSDFINNFICNLTSFLEEKYFSNTITSDSVFLSIPNKIDAVWRDSARSEISFKTGYTIPIPS